MQSWMASGLNILASFLLIGECLPSKIHHSSCPFVRNKEIPHGRLTYYKDENGLCQGRIACDPGYFPYTEEKCVRNESYSFQGDDPSIRANPLEEDDYGSYYEYAYEESSSSSTEDVVHEEEDYSGEEEDYSYEDDSSQRTESAILYQNYEILSNFYKKYYVDLRVIDTSCTPESQPPPEVHHGFLKGFDSRPNVLLPNRSYNVLIYECEPGFVLSEDSTGELFCQENGWIGVHPVCEASQESVLTSTAGPPEDCPPGFEKRGRDCEDVDECRQNNGGCQEICLNVPGSFECRCSSGFMAQGRDCLDVNECLGNNGHGPCQDKCTNTIGGYICSCENIPGSLLSQEDGHACHPQEDLCSESNNGCSHECVSSQGTAFCLCPEGLKLQPDWKTCGRDSSSGVKEENIPSSTPTSDCPNSGFELLENGLCVDINECLNEPCGPLGTCLNRNGSYSCDCPPGYISPSFPTSQQGPCEDVNECEEGRSICGPYGVCQNTPGSYECTCDSGFAMGPQGPCVDVNECEEEGRSICGPYGVCHNTQGSYECSCDRGYAMGPSGSCVDINECEEDESICGPNGVCLNTPGFHECTCDNGYEMGLEGSCADINECEEGKLACGSNGICINTQGSYECTCEHGYEMTPGGSCADLNECEEDPCEEGLLCLNKEGSYECLCPSGLTPNERNSCEDIDECSTDTHDCEHICINSFGSYSCDCQSGYRLSGARNCSDVNECATGEHFCEHNCHNLPGNYSCSCQTGFRLIGRYECEGGPPSCEANGSCSPPQKEPESCPLETIGFQGTNCSHIIGGTTTIGDVCESQCFSEGKIIHVCGPGGLWRTVREPCEPPRGCPPIRPYFPHVSLYPLSCLRDPQAPLAICEAFCPSDMELIGSKRISCGLNAVWAYPDGEPNCLPPSEPPFIICPDPVHVMLRPNEGKALIQVPQPRTNVDWAANVEAEPPWGKTLAFELPGGQHSITFRAQRPDGDFAYEFCTLNISVLDVTPPKVYRCPESINIQLSDKKIYWEEPLFGDNVRVAHIVTNRLPGSKLPLGTHNIIYEARDNQGNRIRCAFEIKVTSRKKRNRKREWVLCRIGSVGRQIKLRLSHVPNGCRKLPD